VLDFDKLNDVTRPRPAMLALSRENQRNLAGMTGDSQTAVSLSSPDAGRALRLKAAS
jgi:hypothetical protein